MLLEPQRFLGAALGATGGWERREKVPGRRLGTISTSAALFVSVLRTELLGGFQLSGGFGGGKQVWKPLVSAVTASPVIP